MKRAILLLSIALAVTNLATSRSAHAADATATDAIKSHATLRAPAEFAAIADPGNRAIALFEEAGKVIRSPRCLNCHPASDTPTQTDAMRPHRPQVLRGPAGTGAPGMPCQTCHHETNFDAAHVPGRAGWHLAPRPMAWAGRSLGEICVQIKDPARNGGRDLTALVRHMAEDALVGWAWSPGADRTPAPGTQQEFGALLNAWVQSGAACPPVTASEKGVPRG
jgi:hypothetical protein